jgi:hypothetical protein
MHAALAFCMLLGLAWTAAALDGGLRDAAAARFGAPPAVLRGAAPWAGGGVQLTRALNGAGFHRALSLRVAVPRTAAARLGACRLVLLQPLPSGLFADPYQLEDLRRTSHAAPQSELLGPLDLEL